MDEIIFRGSQKLENLQIQLNLAAQQSRVIIQQYSERSIALANEIWHSPRMSHLQDITKELIERLVQVAEKGKSALLKVADPRKFFNRLLALLRNELTRRQLLCGCIGFIIGSFIGYSVACFLQKPPIYVCHMKAAVCTSYNGIDSATLIDDIPAPRIECPDDVLIQVRASSVSLVDIAICKGFGKRLRKLLSKYNYSVKTELPVILGRGCSGIVSEIGQNVTKFDIGDEVYLTSPFWAQGTTSELYVAKQFQVAHKPRRIGFEGSAGLPYGGSIALNAVNIAGITKDNAQGKRILVCGACTPSGCVLVQYCHLLGAEVNATSNVKSAPVAKALGADDVLITEDLSLTKLDLETERPKYLLKELELRDPYDFIFITYDLDITRDELRQYLKSEGRIISTVPDYLPSDYFGFISGGIFWSYVRTKCLIQHIFGLPRCNFGEPEIDHEHLEILSKLIDSNEMQSVVDKVYQPHDIEEALEHVQSFSSIGSTIITFR